MSGIIPCYTSCLPCFVSFVVWYCVCYCVISCIYRGDCYFLPLLRSPIYLCIIFKVMPSPVLQPPFLSFSPVVRLTLNCWLQCWFPEVYIKGKGVWLFFIIFGSCITTSFPPILLFFPFFHFICIAHFFLSTFDLTLLSFPIIGGNSSVGLSTREKKHLDITESVMFGLTGDESQRWLYIHCLCLGEQVI